MIKAFIGTAALAILTVSIAFSQQLKYNVFTGKLDLVGSAGGGVSSVTCGTGLTGGVITTSGTCAIDTAVVPTKSAANTFAELQTLQKGANIASSTALASAGDVRYNGGTVQFHDGSGSQTLMNNPFTTRGDMVIQGASGPTRLAAGSSGLFLMANGAAADPSYQTPNASQITNAFDKSTNNSIGSFYMDITEMSAPSAPAANVARFYAKDDGGVTKLCYKDSVGTESCVGAGGGAANYYTNSTATGIGPTSFTPTAGQDFSVLDTTAASGSTTVNIGYNGSGTYTGANTSATSTQFTLVAGQSQGFNNMAEFRNSSGVRKSGVDPYGALYSEGIAISADGNDGERGIAATANHIMGFRVRGTVRAIVSENISGRPMLAVGNGTQITFSQGDITYEYDAGIKRASPGHVAVTDSDTGLGKIVVSQATPSASSDACTPGAIWADANYIYACTASGTIKRATLNTF